MKEIIIKSFEEECGVDLFKLYVDADIKEEELEKALNMASNYASADAEILEKEDAEYYGLDNNWEKVYEEFGNCNGIDRFFGYLKVVYGWEYEDLTYNYEFEW